VGETVKNTIYAATLIMLLCIPFSSAEVVLFEKYDTTMTLESGKLFVTKDLRIKNIGGNPIIPGEVHFKISKEEKGKTIAPIVSSFVVRDRFDKELDTRVITTDREVSLIFTIWDPLLPDFFYDMKMTYELEFKPKGVLFYQVALPEERTTIPISKAITRFEIPKSYHVTYAPGGTVGSENDKRYVSWDGKENYEVEYSVVPLPLLSFKASHIFWILIILIFLVNLAIRFRKKAHLARSP
jgi:hypothetical protein